MIILDDPLCVPKDSNKCLKNASWKWGASWKCFHFTETGGYKHLCNDWAKDTRRCCPEACGNTKPFTKAACETFSSIGECTYPNEAQCGENGESPVKSAHIIINRNDHAKSELRD